MNLNNAKKVRVRFPIGSFNAFKADCDQEVEKFAMGMSVDNLIAVDSERRLLSDMLTAPSIDMGNRKKPRIEVNITWTDDPRYPKGVSTVPQIQYASSDEKRLFGLIHKYGGEIIPVGEWNQCQMEETNLSTGKTYQIERVNEILNSKDFDWNVRK